MAIIKRQQYEAAFKANLALEAVKGKKTVIQIAKSVFLLTKLKRSWRP
jgi:transposase-like protein